MKTQKLIQELESEFISKLKKGEFELTEEKNGNTITAVIDGEYPFRFFLNKHVSSIVSLDKSRSIIKIEPSEEDAELIYAKIHDELERREFARLKEKFEKPAK